LVACSLHTERIFLVYYTVAGLRLKPVGGSLHFVLMSDSFDFVFAYIMLVKYIGVIVVGTLIDLRMVHPKHGSGHKEASNSSHSSLLNAISHEHGGVG
jgi:hypothetical protein